MNMTCQHFYFVKISILRFRRFFCFYCWIFKHDMFSENFNPNCSIISFSSHRHQSSQFEVKVGQHFANRKKRKRHTQFANQNVLKRSLQIVVCIFKTSLTLMNILPNTPTLEIKGCPKKKIKKNNVMKYSLNIYLNIAVYKNYFRI